MPKPLEAINDFVVKFANVNGSGSASANQLFAKSVLRMGVPARDEVLAFVGEGSGPHTGPVAQVGQRQIGRQGPIIGRARRDGHDRRGY